MRTLLCTLLYTFQHQYLDSAWCVHRFVFDLALLGYVTLIAQRREIATEETPLVLTHSFISNSLDEDYSYPEAV